MESPWPMLANLARELADLVRRVFSLERQFSSFKSVKVLNDLDDVEVLYDDTSVQPDGTTVAPIDGDLLTYDASRELWVPDQPAFGIGPVVCSRYTDTGIAMFSDTDIFGAEDPDALWLIHAQVDCYSNGVTGHQVYIDCYDDGSAYVASARTITGDYTSYDMCSVSFPWWPPAEGTGLTIEVGANDGAGGSEDFRLTIRAVRLGDAPATVCASFGA